TIFNTPSGSPASVNNSARRFARIGVLSEGFITKVLPHAMASGNIQQGTIIGKLNGVIPPTTPTGRSEEHTSELQSRFDLVCRLLLEKKKTLTKETTSYEENT